jgi:hypothetical protein
MYVAEAMSSYNVGSVLAAMVMLGCASEKALLLLIDAFAAALPNADARTKFLSRVTGRQIKRQFDQF